MNRWNLSLQALRNDLKEHEKQVIKTAVAIMDSYAELYKIDFNGTEQEQRKTPCDYPDNDGHFHCPFNAQSGDDCRRFCGLGVDD